MTVFIKRLNWRKGGMNTFRDRGRDSGLMVVELAVLAPVFIGLALLSISLGRVGEARQQVVEAARAGAEAAAVLPTVQTAQWVGSMNVVINLVDRTHTCSHVAFVIDTSRFVPGGQAVVHVACQVLLSDVVAPGIPGSTVVSATATAPIDPYRAVG